MKKLLPLFIAVVSLASVAKSELVLDNITNTGSGGSLFDSNFTLSQSFVTSSGSWNLDDVVLRISGFGSGIGVGIYEDSANLPGASLATLSGPSSNSSGSYSNLTYTSTGLLLTGNTRYWIVVGATDMGDLQWAAAANSTTTGAWSIPGTNPSAVLSTWTPWMGQNTIYNFSINASAPAPVPEPGTWTAAALLAGGAAFARWRRRRESE